MKTKKSKINNRVGCRGGDYLYPTSFRNVNFTPKFVSQVQKMYWSKEFTQEQLAIIFKVSISLINKMVRCDPRNVKETIKSNGRYSYS